MAPTNQPASQPTSQPTSPAKQPCDPGDDQEVEEDAVQEEQEVDTGNQEGNDVDEDDRLGEDCIKLLSATEADGPYRNFMKNAKGEEPFEFWIAWERAVWSYGCNHGYQSIYQWHKPTWGSS